jgi:GntR family transcriptional repressor for pyruvate dehydrogenase complex
LQANFFEKYRTHPLLFRCPNTNSTLLLHTCFAGGGSCHRRPKIEKDLLHLKVIRRILSQIGSGVYRQGQRLPAERKLCEAFGVSRGTLRRALADLKKMGVVQIEAQSGAYVQKTSKLGAAHPVLPADIIQTTLSEILAARKAIELAAIELACQRASKTDIKLLQQCIDQMEANVDSLPDCLQFDMAFHEQLVKSSRNPALIAAFEAISDYHRYSQIFSSSSETCETDAIKHHRRILAALSAGNASKAVSALRRHFDDMLTTTTEDL